MSADNVVPLAPPPAPDPEEIARFLRWLGAPLFAVTSIVGEGKNKRTHTATFAAEQAAEAAARAAERNAAGENLYVMLNPPRAPLARKAEKEDVAAARFLWVDCDPRAGEDPATERARTLARLRAADPPFSAIIDSGNGYWGIYQLEEPIVLASADDVREAEERGYTLEWAYDAYGADRCRNVDRICRLPGTVNWPDARKRDRGRVPVAARIVELSDRAYPAEAFARTALPEAAATDSVRAAAPSASLSTEHWPEDLRVLALAGSLPEPRKGQEDVSRSGWVWQFCREADSAGIPEADIWAALLCKDFGISASIYENKKPREYAKRQIARARKNASKGEPAPEGGIVVQGGELTPILDQAEAAMRAAGAPIYQRKGELLRVLRLDKDDDAEKHGTRRLAGSVQLTPVVAPWLIEQMGRAAEWWRYNAKGKLYRIDPPPQYATQYLARSGEWRFPELSGIAQAPTLTRDGRIIQEEGYDAASGLLLAFGGVQFPPVSPAPDKGEATAALQQIKQLLSEFPFVSGADRSVALSAILTALVRASLGLVPLHGFDAPAHGTGKTYLAALPGLIATGRKPPVMTQGDSPEEDKKELSSVLLSGDQMLILDNCLRDLDGAFLAALLTSDEVKVRYLGFNRLMWLSTTVLLLATGNNLTAAGELGRRVVKCRLDTKDERPDKRTFTFDCHAQALEQRAELVVAGLTVLRAYHVAGRPAKLPPMMAGFGDWDWVRGALVWLGEPDPADTNEEIITSDPKKAELLEVIELWEDTFGARQLTLAEVETECRTAYPGDAGEHLLHRLKELSGRGGVWNARSLGWWMRRNKGRFAGGRCFRCDPKGGARLRWWIEAAEGTSPVAGPPERPF